MKIRIPARVEFGSLAILALAAGFLAGCTPAIEKLWEFPTASPLYSTPLVTGELIVFGSEGGALHAVDTKGQARWQFTLPSAEIFAHPQTDGKLIFFGATNQTFHAVDTKGQEKWRFTAKERIKSDPAVVDGVVYMTSYDGHIYALSAESGKKIWQFPAPEVAPPPPLLILTVTKQNTAFLNDKAVDPKDLEAKLTEALKDQKDGAISLNLDPALKPADHAKLTALVKKAGFEKTTVIALEAGEKFQAPLVPKPPPPAAPSIKPAEFSYAAPVIKDGVLYVGNLDGTMYAINTADGTMKWRFQAGSGITSTAWVEGGVVYFGSKDSNVYAIDSATGSQVKWKFKTGGDVLSSPRLLEGSLTIGSNDGNFYLLDVQTGKEKCHFTATGPIISYGAYYKNLVFFAGGQGDNTIYAMDRTNCKPFWSHKTGYKIESDPVIEGDHLYVTSGDMKLYAFKINKTPEK